MPTACKAGHKVLGIVAVNKTERVLSLIDEAANKQIHQHTLNYQ